MTCREKSKVYEYDWDGTALIAYLNAHRDGEGYTGAQNNQKAMAVQHLVNLVKSQKDTEHSIYGCGRLSLPEKAVQCLVIAALEMGCVQGCEKKNWRRKKAKG